MLISRQKPPESTLFSPGAFTQDLFYRGVFITVDPAVHQAFYLRGGVPGYAPRRFLREPPSRDFVSSHRFLWNLRPETSSPHIGSFGASVLEDSLRARHALFAGDRGDGLPERPTKGLEDRLALVVIRPSRESYVGGETAVGAEARKEVLEKLRRDGPEGRGTEGAGEDEVAPPAAVEGNLGKGLVHGDGGKAEPPDPLPVAH